MILVVGASVRGMMASAGMAGYQVQGLDFFADVDSQKWGPVSSLVKDYHLEANVANLLKIAVENMAESPLVYGAGPENYPLGLKNWQEKNLLYGNAIEDLLAVRDPIQLKASLVKVGGKMPEFYPLNSMDSLPTNKEWLVKPLNRGGGQGIIRLTPQDQTLKEIGLTLKDPDKYIVEEYIWGIPASLTFLANGQEAQVIGSSKQIMGNKQPDYPFCYGGNIVPLNMDKVYDDDVFWQEGREIAQGLTQDFNLKGLNTLDLIINDQGIWVLEVNPRWSASVELIESFLGKSLFPTHLGACQGWSRARLEKEISPLSPPGGFYGKLIVYAESRLIINYQYADERELLYIQGVRDIPEQDTVIDIGEPLCTVLAGAPDDHNCRVRLGEKSLWVQEFYRLRQRSL